MGNERSIKSSKEIGPVRLAQETGYLICRCMTNMATSCMTLCIPYQKRKFLNSMTLLSILGDTFKLENTNV